MYAESSPKRKSIRSENVGEIRKFVTVASEVKLRWRNLYACQFQNVFAIRSGNGMQQVSVDDKLFR